MFCNKCGEKVPDDSLFCSKCGAKIQGSSGADSPGPCTLTVDRKSQLYLINPPIKVVIDGKIRASVENGHALAFSLSKGKHKIELISSLRTKSLEFDMKGDAVLEIGFNRLTGALTAKFS